MATIDTYVDTDSGHATDYAGYVNGTTWWAVGFDAGDDDAGVNTPVVDSDTVTFSTSDFSGTLKKVILLSGAWASSTAAGIILIDDITGTAPVDGETVTFSGGASATTNVGGTQTWDACSKNAGPLDDMAAAEAWFQQDLPTNGHDLNIYCAGTAEDTTQCIISGWTTGASNRLKIAGDPNETDGAHNQGSPSYGQWSTSHYRLSVANTGTSGAIQPNEAYLDFEDLQFECDGTGLMSFYNNGSATGENTFNRCYIRYNGSNANGRCVDCRISQATVNNTIIEGVSAQSLTGLWVQTSGHDVDFFTTLITGFNASGGEGIYGQGGTTCSTEDCVIFNNESTITGSIAATATYTAFDGTVSGTGNKDFDGGAGTPTNWATAMENYASGDFRPSDTSGTWLDGTGSGVPSGTDITGTTWANANIGPHNDEVPAAAGGNSGNLMLMGVG